MVIRSFTTDLPHPYNKAGDGPEGPEVRTVADKLRPRILGRTLRSGFHSDLFENKIFGWSALPIGSKIKEVRSYGKKVLLHFDLGLTMMFSLGMTGRLWYTRTKHTHVLLGLAADDEPSETLLFLCFDDPRRFGSFKILNNIELQNELADLGPDLLEAALSTEISSESWLTRFRSARKSSRVIIDLLVDQAYVSGIGWYLATEILYHSGIHPERQGRDIKESEWEDLRQIAHYLIYVSYSYGGLTIESFISPDAEPGLYPASIYGKERDPLGRKVSQKKFKTRTLTFVDEVQR